MDIALSMGEYSLVYNMLSLTIAAFGASAVFFFIARGDLHKHYRLSVLVSGIVVLIAFYHYLRIFQSWEAAYTLVDGMYEPSGKPFNDAYRYVDWLLTVPLLLVELVLVMRLDAKTSRSLLVRLVTAAVLMIALGYPGEITPVEQEGTRWLWWALSMIPFLYILYVLLVEFTKSLDSQPEKVRGLVSAARFVIVVVWLFYPIAYLLPQLGLSGGAGIVGLQVGYSIADILAKAGFGLYIWTIAARKSELEGA